MKVSVRCPNCKVKLTVAERLIGKLANCPGCSARIRLEAPAAKPPPEPEPPKPDPAAAEASESSEAADDANTYRLASPERRDESPSAVYSSVQAPERDFVAETSPAIPPRKSRPKQAKAGGSKSRSQPSEASSDRRWPLYAILFATMVPLLISVFFGDSDVAERLERSLEQNADVLDNVSEDTSLEQLVSQLPDQKIIGAHLGRDTKLHWLYALVSFVVFVTFFMLLFRNVQSGTGKMIGSALFTATVGILLLLGFQWLAAVSASSGFHVRGLVGLIFLVVKLIGFSYSAAMDPSNGFLESMLGFTFGVGLCEEICKAIPVVVFLRESRASTWRGACLVGLASGIGFGTAEGIIYSADYYNGIMGADIYVVRFISCVALHSVWAGAAAVIMYYNQSYLPGEADWTGLLLGIVVYLGIAIVLHGLYDTLLKQDMPVWALVTALASIGWFVFVLEYHHEVE